ncbi:hypothetical protein [Elioraea sp.]|uniref:hypothetical protein n=1 Tax=Elioraea sp. TaxID=2185103 RepID=UPI003F7259D8
MAVDDLIGPSSTEGHWGLALNGRRYELALLRGITAGHADLFLRTVPTAAGTNETALFSSIFADIRDASTVHAVGVSLVDRLNGVLLLRDPTREPISVLYVLQRTQTAQGAVAIYKTYAFSTGNARGRARALAVADTTAPIPPPEPQWVIDSFGDDAVAGVLTYLRGEPDWFDLWKAFERMRADIKHRVGGNWKPSDVGWPSKSTMDHFTKSVNFVRHSGAATPQGVTAENAMTLAEARAFLACRVRQWLEWRSGRS